MYGQPDSDGPEQGSEQIIIKKYANRRLYNTATSNYITLDHLAQMVREDVEFIVLDAKTSEDITRSILTHIIVEEETKGRNMLPISFLRQLISLYGDSLQELVPGYLDSTMKAFTNNQEQMRGYMNEALDGIKPFSPFEEIGKQNMAFFENAIKMLTPYPPSSKKDSPSQSSPDKNKGPEDLVRELKAQLDQMQKQLNDLSDDS